MRNSSPLIFAALLLAAPLVSQAGNGEAIVGSILGGATGAIIGNNVGGRDGAIVGGAIGAAAGVAIATDNNNGNRRYDNNRHDDRRGRDGYYNTHDDYRHRNDYNRYDRYDRRYDRYDNDHRREVVVVESPRYYYQGNDFVYGVPSHYDNGRHRGWERNRHHDRGPDVIIIQPAPRRW